MTATAAAAPKKKRNYLIAYLWFSAVLLSVLIVVVVLLVLQNRSNIAANHDSNIQQCRVANVTRQQDIAIWNSFLRLQPDLTAASRASLDHLIEVKDTQRDCAAAFSEG